ncbi:MAG: lysylphosphatidylglycerol synthetase family protein [Phaeodactylibacter sp.]|nr:lysylphosphatidylglycerol synthetase family protein [Phaeodactylibacter sp.]
MRNKALHYFHSNQKLILQASLALLFIGLGVYFIRHERAELGKVAESLAEASTAWVLAGIAFALLFSLVQGLMYQYSFRAIHEHIGLGMGMRLFLKRNLVSVFLPAGTLTNILFFNREVERKEGVERTQIYFASTIFSICSILSSIIIGLPALLWLFFSNGVSGGLAIGLFATIALIAALGWAVYSFKQGGWAHQWAERLAPSFFDVLKELEAQDFSRKDFWIAILLSCGIELIGITHLYIAIEALGAHANLEVAIVGYGIVLLLLMSSPFLRGIGAIEVALTYALTLYGFDKVTAISITFLFRFFEFWSILVLGLLALIGQRDNALLRLGPSFLLLALGIVNILSALTPAAPARLKLLMEFLPMEAIHASTYFVLVSGILMMALAAYLIRGLRTAWLAAIALSGLSLAAHLAKGVDYEEATIALATLAALWYQRNQYFIRPDPQFAQRTLFPGLAAVGGVLLFGLLGFHWIGQAHFGTGLNWRQAAISALRTFFLLDTGLPAATPFAQEFTYSMNILGAGAMLFFAFMLLRPYIFQAEPEAESRQQAQSLLGLYGRSSLDYFKTYTDKLLFFTADGQAFVSFRATSQFAVALENPVAADAKQVEKAVIEFDEYCRRNGLRTVYYRIPERDRPLYEKLNKKLLPIGEDATVNLDTFNLQGKDKKDMRNAVNKLERMGYTFRAYPPPQKDGFLQQLRAVSDDWLRDTGRAELVFSQGLFDEKALKEHTILTVESQEGKIVSFVNQIPDYRPGEANFDLMRKTADAPNGAMDFLFVKMLEYFKAQGFHYCNLGMVPMSGIEKATNAQEAALKLAYERIGQFAHYRSLRAHKEKFEPDWTMTYLAYPSTLDLAFLPNALNQVVEL